MTKTGRKVAAFDIDGTLIRWQLYHAVTDRLFRMGAIEPATYKTVREARQQWKKRALPFKSYEQHLVNAFSASLSHMSASQVDRAVTDVIDEYKDQVYAYTRELITDLQTQGYLLFAISGSHQEIVEQLSRHYGFDDWVGSVYERKGDAFTGNYSGPLGRKDDVLRGLVSKHSATMEGSVAVGDSSGDIAMLDIVSRPIAFNPEKELFEYAKSKGWSVVIERKNMIYELEHHDGSYLLA